MEYSDVLKNAKKLIKEKCRVCRECNGIACRGEIPGVGGKGTGSSFIRNREKLNEVKIHLNTIVKKDTIDTSIELFGEKFKYPVFAAPIAAVGVNYSDALNDLEYSKVLVGGCRKAVY